MKPAVKAASPRGIRGAWGLLRSPASSFKASLGSLYSFFGRRTAPSSVIRKAALLLSSAVAASSAAFRPRHLTSAAPGTPPALLGLRTCAVSGSPGAYPPSVCSASMETDSPASSRPKPTDPTANEALEEPIPVVETNGPDSDRTAGKDLAPSADVAASQGLPASRVAELPRPADVADVSAVLEDADGKLQTEPDSIPEREASEKETTIQEEPEPYWKSRPVFSSTTVFDLTSSCKLVLHKGDITEWAVDKETDAIVNAANERMLGGGGVDGAIHRAAGPELLALCREKPEVRRGVRCPTGSAVTTGAARLPVKYVIHTVGPIYDAVADPAQLLSLAYRSSAEQAVSHGVQYLAFPAISCGIYGYPLQEAAQVSLGTLKTASQGMKEIHFVLFGEPQFQAWRAEAQFLLMESS